MKYVRRDLTSPEGGFYSAEDADSEGEEGKFYLWTRKELEEALGKEDAAFFAEIYNFEDAGNYLDESTHKRTGGNIPHLSLPLEKLADERKLDPGQLVARAQSMRAKLFALRMERIHPQKDDKVLTAWNGLMISAFARAPVQTSPSTGARCRRATAARSPRD